MKDFSKTVSPFYKVIRSLSVKMYYFRRDLEFYEDYRSMKRHIPGGARVSNEVFRRYKELWGGWSRSPLLPRNILEVCSTLSEKETPEYLPENIYFSTIDPLLNNKQMAWGYAEKGRYARLFDIDNEPVSFLRNLNGLFFDYKGQLIQDPDGFMENALKTQSKILVKPPIESWGGRDILVFKKDANDRWQCLNDDVELSINNLQKYYSKNYVVQEYVEQHPFYMRFNPSSFNTFRIYVYRSVRDEKPYVLHSALRVGSSGSVVDNVKSGGVGIYVKADGTFVHGHNKHMEKIDFLPNEPNVKLSEVGKAPGLDKIHELAKKVALKMPFTRLVAFDINLDTQGEPRLIELNTSNAGLVPQFYGSTFFGAFTLEVIEYCEKQ